MVPFLPHIAHPLHSPPFPQNITKTTLLDHNTPNPSGLHSLTIYTPLLITTPHQNSPQQHTPPTTTTTAPTTTCVAVTSPHSPRHNTMSDYRQERDRDRDYGNSRPDRHHSRRNYNERDERDYRRDRREDDEDAQEHRAFRGRSDRRGPSELDRLHSRGPGAATEQEYDTAKDMEVTQNFADMHLKPELSQGLLQFGIVKPSSVQQRVMTPILKGHDVIAQAPSGTGKTTIFAIALLQLVDTSLNSPQALALFPTRELAQQTRVAMKAMGGFMQVKVHACIGGKSVQEDVDALSKGQHIVTGTPGRVYDLIKRTALNTKHIKAWVIDEADEMLSQGFKDQIYYIYRYLPTQIQIMLVSATLPNDVLLLTSKFMTNPVRILVKRDELSLNGIRQFFVGVEKEEWKYETLIDLYELLTITQSVVFVNTRETCELLAKRMREENFMVEYMHGDMNQEDRDTVMAKFRAAEARVLITTDIWGRGIDVQQVSLVINYDLPQSREAYLHRIGRSGRFGRKGVAINLTVPSEKHVLDDIAQYYGIVIEEMPASLNM